MTSTFMIKRMLDEDQFDMRIEARYGEYKYLALRAGSDYSELRIDRGYFRGTPYIYAYLITPDTKQNPVSDDYTRYDYESYDNNIFRFRIGENDKGEVVYLVVYHDGDDYTEFTIDLAEKQKTDIYENDSDEETSNLASDEQNLSFIDKFTPNQQLAILVGGGCACHIHTKQILERRLRCQAVGFT